MSEQLSQPKEIKIASKIFYAMIATSLFLFIITRFSEPIPISVNLPPPYKKEIYYLDPNSYFAIITSIITMVIVFFIFSKILKGKNWARILYMLLVLYGVISLIYDPKQTLSQWQLFNPLWIRYIFILITIISWILSIAFLIFVFSNNSNAWYAAIKKEKDKKKPEKNNAK
jgi:cellulose synthase/poly-beta-1,6-N-acetylglucosamine synthase-like glycosyltransferase